MGFLDKLKTQASDVASTVVEKTQETARTGQIQVQLRTLRNEERDLMADFGREAHRLYGEGTLGGGSSELTNISAKIADVRARLADKEAEAADMRGEGRPADENTVEAEAEEIVDASSRTSSTGTSSTTGSGAGGSTSSSSRRTTASTSSDDAGDETGSPGTP
jgi:hypothetical protein